MSKPTPRPLVILLPIEPIDDRYMIVSYSDEGHRSHVAQTKSFANAALIVKCVNLHDELVEIAQAALKMHTIYCCQHETEDQMAESVGEEQARKTFEYNEFIRSVLAKAETP